MKNQGFTLIEIIVAMAIVSIMAGVIVPISYRIWETKEIEVTRSRMAALKQAMVGDKELYQNGVKTDYGFVGDVGELPELIVDLVADRGVYANWNGPYLVSGYDPGKYNKDTWGQDIIYQTSFDASGRRVSANLMSKGPDRILNTADDINTATAPQEQLYAAEVAPANRIEGNVAYAITVSEADETPVYYTNVVAEYRDLGVPVTSVTNDCAQIDVGLVQKLAPRNSSLAYTSAFPANLPVGKTLMKSRLYANSSCTGAPLAESDPVAFFVSDGLGTIYVNLPALYYHIMNGP